MKCTTVKLGSLLHIQLSTYLYCSIHRYRSLKKILQKFSDNKLCIVYFIAVYNG